jgi:DedD protein
VREKGYQPYVIQSDVPGRGRWYRVRLGKFPTQEAAGRYLRDFRRETRLNAFVTRIDES